LTDRLEEIKQKMHYPQSDLAWLIAEVERLRGEIDDLKSIEAHDVPTVYFLEQQVATLSRQNDAKDVVIAALRETLEAIASCEWQSCRDCRAKAKEAIAALNA